MTGTVGLPEIWKACHSYKICERLIIASYRLSLPGTAEPQPPLSPYLRPLPAPPVDAEVLDLQAQV